MKPCLVAGAGVNNINGEIITMYPLNSDMQIHYIAAVIKAWVATRYVLLHVPILQVICLLRPFTNSVLCTLASTISSYVSIGIELSTCNVELYYGNPLLLYIL